ncbi:MAG: hypothetical protein MSIBF_03845 [Candidatus Altiarchaeales archaeon IMC4]|nr:MAG: hypothetical protein MSIBF_03845 [Candidatus Altiarchaeales archaeon IMC4]
MYSHTKKVGSAGRYGARMGRRLRDIISKLEVESRKVSCPACRSEQVKREAAGIWKCRTCSAKFTGGAHLQSPAAR